MTCHVCSLPILDRAQRSGAALLESRRCPFCATTFSRADGARRHAKRCSERGNRALDPAKRGRKPLSCDRCSRLKLHCNAGTYTPCASCLSKKLPCEFSRYCTDVNHRAAASDGVVVPAVVPQTRTGRVPLSFLLNATDDNEDFFTERAVSIEPAASLLGVLAISDSSTPPGARNFFNDDLFAFIDPTFLTLPGFQSDLFNPSSRYNKYEGDLLGSLIWSASQTDPLQAQIDLLGAELIAFAQSRERLRDSYDADAFRRFFEPTNVRRFAAAFCRKRHYRFRIIHWPTLVLETTPHPLLLVIALTGASYTYQDENESEDINNSRKFYGLADAYVFDKLDAGVDRLPSDIDVAEAISLCQAALLMYGLNTLLVGDEPVQCKNAARRLPAMITALRRFNFLAVRHLPDEDWRSFLQREQISRVVAWTYCVDCLATLLCNVAPISSLMEMTGDMPCEDSVWDVEPPDDLASPGPPHGFSSRCLKDLLTSFLDGKVLADVNVSDLSLFNLQLVMIGFEQVVFNMHVTRALPDQSGKLLRAFDVWNDLWTNAFQRIPQDQHTWLGVTTHMPTLAMLTRTIVEKIGQRGAAGSRYLQRIPCYSQRDLHDFIREFGVDIEEM